MSVQYGLNTVFIGTTTILHRLIDLRGFFGTEPPFKQSLNVRVGLGRELGDDFLCLGASVEEVFVKCDTRGIPDVLLSVPRAPFRKGMNPRQLIAVVGSMRFVSEIAELEQERVKAFRAFSSVRLGKEFSGELTPAWDHIISSHEHRTL